ncbi:PAAR domain-containing protein [Pseudomonas sp. SWRI59]|uniref:PAAR domain-containing protein n=1 Tax=unclassified Pseudomonas TaxID=196821 RepID=UPI0016452F32|nr:PAAR domain-containing protein [Pseudomonas sp. SWRI59]MBC3507148.1 PAAR domain-containing protein [Pseudomonas sp. SWRI68]
MCCPSPSRITRERSSNSITPMCKGAFPIIEGSDTYLVNGIPVALDGMKTACGASLIASASHGSVHP